MKIYRYKFQDVTMSTPAKNKKDALQAFKQMAEKSLFANPDWIKLAGVKERKAV